MALLADKLVKQRRVRRDFFSSYGPKKRVSSRDTEITEEPCNLRGVGDHLVVEPKQDNKEQSLPAKRVLARLRKASIGA